MALKLVLFDVDGTLLDSRWSIVTAMTLAYEASGLPPPSPDSIKHIVGLSLAEAISTMTPELGPEWRRVIGESYRNAYMTLDAGARKREPLFPGVVEVLNTLDEAGLLLGVVTGKSRAGLDAVLKRHDLADRFVTLQTSDNMPSKPAPDLVLKALRETGAEALDTVVVGDTSHDILMAKNAHVRTVGVTWGFHERSVLEEAGADRLADDASDLPELICGMLGVSLGEAA